MRKNISFTSEYAVSELVGGLILVVVAVIVFSVILLYVYPLPIPAPEPNVKLMGYINEDGLIVVEHMGGESLSNYKIYARDANGTLIDTKTYHEEDPWEIGECIYPLTDIHLQTVDDVVGLIINSIYEDGSEHTVFNAILKGQGREPIPSVPPMLVSSLLTDTTDEDLICFNYTIVPEIDALTYIYRWLVDGKSFAEILLPFDTQSATVTKDYSENGHNGSLVGVTWSCNGVIGGSYYFGGASDYIAMSLPSIFDNTSNNDFAICLWVKSDDITDDWRVVLEARKDNKNFVKIFQFGTEIHFGVCENGVRRAMRTENLTSNTWYHIAGVWDASEKSIALYVNGTVCTETGNRNYAYGSHVGVHLGHGTASSRFWLGFMDELQIYDHVLSGNQAYQIYRCTKDGYSDKRVIVSEETTLGDIWQCIVTPNDSTQDGAPVESNILEIVSYSGGV